MGPVAYMKAPKLLPPKGIEFSSDNKFMCLAERRECKDQISIYYAGHDWKMVNSFDTTETYDLVDCKWTMQNTAILVQDNPLEARFVIYAALTGNPIAVHKPDAQMGLGVRSLLVSPSAKMIACGLYETSLFLYNNLTQIQIC
jgi:hypothetical protein